MTASKRQVSDHSSDPEETPPPELISGFQTVAPPGGSEIWEDWGPLLSIIV